MVQIEITKQPLYGSVEWNGYEFIYTPREGFTGNDIYYYIRKENGVSQLLKNYVNPTNIPPITRDLSLLADAYSATTINFDDIITDTTNPFDDLKIIEITPVINGVVNTDGTNIYYTPNTLNTIETFIYTVSDKQFIETGTITLSVINGIERKPVEPDTFKYRFHRAYVNSVGFQNLSSNWQNATHILTTYQNTWDSLSLSALRYIEFSNIVEKISSNLNKLYNKKDLFDQIYSIVEVNSGLWITDTDIIDIPKYHNQDWINAYNLLTATSSTWNNTITSYSSVSADYYSKFDGYQVIENTVYNHLSTWNSRGLEIILDNVWDIPVPIVQSSSANWNTTYSTTTSLSTDFYDSSKLFNITFETLNKYLSVWEDTRVETIMLSAPEWDYVYSRKEDYDNLYSLLTTISGDWIKDTVLVDSLTSSMSTVSGGIDTTYQTISNGDKLNHWNILDNVSSLSSEHDYNTLYNLVTSITSLEYEIAQVMLSASKWDAVYSKKEDYDNLYTYLSSQSGSWIKDSSSFSVMVSADNYNTIRDLLTGGKVDYWNILDNVSSLSSEHDYNTLYNLVTSITSLEYEIAQVMLSASKWDAVYSKKEDYDNLYTYLSSQSGSWIKDTSLTAVMASADNYNTIYNIITGDKPKELDKLDNSLKILEKYDYNSIYNFITANSATKYELVLSSYNLSSIYWDSLYYNLLQYSDGYSTAGNLSSLFSDQLTSRYDTFYRLVTGSNDKWKNYVSSLSVVILSASEWNKIGDNVPTYTLLYNTVCANSATLLTATTGVSGLSGTLTTNVKNWNAVTPIIQSSNIQGIITLTNSISTTIDKNKIKFASLDNTVNENKRYWPGVDFYNILSSTSSWNSNNDLINNKGKASYWNGIVTEYISTYTSISNISAKNNLLYSYVPANTGSWQYNKIITATVSTNSANWDGSYTSVTGNSALWSFYDTTSTYRYMDMYNFLSVASGNLANSYTTLTGKSALWLSGNSFLSVLSTQYLTGNSTMGFSAKDLTVKNLTIKGNLTTYGARTIINNSVQVLDQFEINNAGNNNAVEIDKNGNNAIIQFQNISSTVMYVKATPKVVGINLSAALTDPTISLTVSGDISASGYTYPYPSYITAYSGLSTRYETTFSYITGISGLVANYQNSISAYDLFLSYIPSTSGFVTITIPYYNNYYKTVSSYSTKNNVVCGFVTSNSGDWEKDSGYRSNQYKYDTTYTYLTGNSATFYGKYNIGYLFTERSILEPKKVDLLVQDNIRILSWKMASDINTIATIDVLSTDHFNYERNGYPVSIVNGNYPSLNSTRKNTMNNLSTIWIGDYIPKGSILRFAVTNNTAASSILIDLVVQKQ